MANKMYPISVLRWVWKHLSILDLLAWRQTSRAHRAAIDKLWPLFLARRGKSFRSPTTSDLGLQSWMEDLESSCSPFGLFLGASNRRWKKDVKRCFPRLAEPSAWTCDREPHVRTLGFLFRHWNRAWRQSGSFGTMWLPWMGFQRLPSLDRLHPFLFVRRPNEPPQTMFTFDNHTTTWYPARHYSVQGMNTTHQPQRSCAYGEDAWAPFTDQVSIQSFATLVVSHRQTDDDDAAAPDPSMELCFLVCLTQHYDFGYFYLYSPLTDHPQDHAP